MKTIRLKSLSVILAVMLLSFGTQLNAQRYQGKNMQNKQNFECNIPDLTDEQKSKIEVLKVSHLKEVTTHKNLMSEKRAHLNTLRTADKPDMNAINKTLDEIGALRTNMQKKSEAHRQSVRALLTDNQRVYFDARKGNRMHKGNMKGKGMGNGRGVNCPNSK
ncbi:MAG: periplasmic heavy metal sensor [Bacteroidales bacterium]|nr:periplasmic heavy metal sensor [Bacteroidales bacterium]MBN2758814.1 periplasmic heavy metal sensor [Bacteroidales bacterium]